MSELSRETKALLSKARTPEPLAPAHRARLKAAVLANVAATTIVATSTTAAATGALGTTQLLVAFGIGATVGAGAVAMHYEVTTPMVVQTAAPAESLATAQVTARTAPAPVATVTVSAGAQPVALEEPVTHPAPVPAPERETEPDTEPSTGSAVSSAQPTVRPLSPHRALQEEVQLIREADRRIRAGDGNGALRVLAEHERLFPRGVLAPERGVQRVLALCAEGRIQEARAQGAALIRGHGPLADRARASCAGR